MQPSLPAQGLIVGLTLGDYLSAQVNIGSTPFLCPIDLESGTCGEYTTAQCVELVDACARRLARALSRLEHIGHTNEERIEIEGNIGGRLVVGMLGVDWMEYWVNRMALSQLGHIPFPISILLAPSAIAQLLAASKASHLFYGRGTEQLVEQVMREHASGTEISRPACTEWIHLEDLSCTTTVVKEETAGQGLSRTYGDPGGSQSDLGRRPGLRAREMAQLAHTTGSTSLPKIIPISHSSLLHSHAISGPGSSLILASLSQGYGLYIPFACLSHRSRCYVHSPRPGMTVAELLRVLKIASERNEGKIDVLFASPRMLEILAGTGEAGLTLLRRFGRVVIGGAPPSRRLLIWAEGKDLPVVNFMGSMETGYLVDSGSPRSAGWDWFEVAVEDRELIAFERYDAGSGAGIPAGITEGGSTTHRESGGGVGDAMRYLSQEAGEHEDTTDAGAVSPLPLYELVVRPDHPRLNITNRPDGCYATGDLFVPHPIERGKWQFRTRKDDVIVHSTGMKTDPALIEARLYESPLVKQVVVIGSGYPMTAILVVPSSWSVILEDLWPTIERLNQVLPLWSKLVPRRVRLLSPDDELPVSAKGQVIRHKVMEDYSEIIARIYA